MRAKTWIAESFEAARLHRRVRRLHSRDRCEYRIARSSVERCQARE
jgi:hypothetical protein